MSELNHCDRNALFKCASCSYMDKWNVTGVCPFWRTLHDVIYGIIRNRIIFVVWITIPLRSQGQE